VNDSLNYSRQVLKTLEWKEVFGTAKLGLIFNLNQKFLKAKSKQKSQVVDRAGLEPATSSMPWRRSSN
jgi:hypothetical protein